MLEARDIRFSYPGTGRQLFDGLSLSVGPGQRLALSAPSGFGKTTLCRILAGYVRPDEGGVFVEGEPLSEKGVCPVQLVGQHPELAVDPRMRMRDVLAEAGEVDRDVTDALGIASSWFDRLPHELSGGELQRFCIARARIARPRYLIADEVSTRLDALTQAQL
ncbi:MAG: ATP-binding cassette domain-containing protein, partial [Eggerthellaceae bacterium]|nr:ATP-binding cassette domain-containing protein [Eggerthellaceae bacterium]